MRREAEAGKRRYKHVECVRGVASKSARIGQRVDDLGPVPERPRPAVAEDNRNRRLALAGFIEKVNRHVVNDDAIVGIAVDLTFRFSPIERIDPIFDELLEISAVNAIKPIFVPDILWPSRRAQARLEILELFV